jgi:hypothetical protein
LPEPPGKGVPASVHRFLLQALFLRQVFPDQCCNRFYHGFIHHTHVAAGHFVYDHASRGESGPQFFTIVAVVAEEQNAAVIRTRNVRLRQLIGLFIEDLLETKAHQFHRKRFPQRPGNSAPELVGMVGSLESQPAPHDAEAEAGFRRQVAHRPAQQI